jgi:hypothetical protein
MTSLPKYTTGSDGTQNVPPDSTHNAGFETTSQISLDEAQKNAQQLIDINKAIEIAIYKIQHPDPPVNTGPTKTQPFRPVITTGTVFTTPTTTPAPPSASTSSNNTYLIIGAVVLAGLFLLKK